VKEGVLGKFALHLYPIDLGSTPSFQLDALIISLESKDYQAYEIWIESGGNRVQNDAVQILL
jgi:hypothetical protein